MGTIQKHLVGWGRRRSVVEGDMEGPLLGDTGRASERGAP